MAGFDEYKVRRTLELLYKRRGIYATFHGKVTAKDIAKMFRSLSTRTIYTHLNRMQDDGVIEKKEDAWEITDKGIEMYKILKEEHKREKENIKADMAQKYPE